jgi:Domain of unknown function (DUF4410)
LGLKALQPDRGACPDATTHCPLPTNHFFCVSPLESVFPHFLPPKSFRIRFYAKPPGGVPSCLRINPARQRPASPFSLPQFPFSFLFSVGCGLFSSTAELTPFLFSRIRTLFTKNDRWAYPFPVSFTPHSSGPLACPPPARRAGLLRLSCALILLIVAALPQLAQAQAPGSKPTIYVSDFDLDVVPEKPAPSAPANTSAPSTQRPGTPAKNAADKKAADKNKDEDPAKFAARLVDLVSTNLVQALQSVGYNAQRLGRNAGRPDNGLQIRGLFAEIDKENHWRRGVIHTADDSGRFQLLVSVANLTKPEQALYEIARLPGNENKPGAVITLSSYVPLEKFEIDKDVKEDQIKKAAARIASDVDKLLNANPAAVPK